MHGVFITFQSEARLEDLQGPFLEVAEALLDVPGLLSKTWIQEGERIGGFFIFSDAASAEAYLHGPIAAGIKANPAFSDFEVRQLTVLEDFSAMTNGVPAARQVL